MTSTTIQKQDAPSRFPATGKSTSFSQKDPQGFDEKAGMKLLFHPQSRCPFRAPFKSKPAIQMSVIWD
jgi:hypothetical protein